MVARHRDVHGAVLRDQPVGVRVDALDRAMSVGEVEGKGLLVTRLHLRSSHQHLSPANARSGPALKRRIDAP